LRVLWDSGNIGFGGCGINEWDRHIVDSLRSQGVDVTLLVDKNLKRRPKFKTWNPPKEGYTFVAEKITAKNYKEVVESLGPFDIQIGNHFTMFPVLDRILPVVHDVSIPKRKSYSLGIELSLGGICSLTERFLCTSPFIENQVLGMFPQAKTWVTWAGAKFATSPCKKVEGGRKPYIAYWGNRYAEGKNFLALLETLNYHNLDLCVSSYLPPSEKELAFVEKHNLGDRVQFYTGLNDEALQILIEGASLYVCPSTYEGLGLPPIEAMGVGVPVVVSPCASLPGVVGDCGIIADSHKAKDLSAAILKVLADPKATLARTEKGKTWAGNFTWERASQVVLEAAIDTVR
jgi:glycosyltransferase involved in cell wall biosynthesis